ncbi:MAG: hypothetical protein M5U15_08160 [Kiritimatiellae bacterium]|nr:hypothetical protein [Kiritimatiellia bacterium]
MFNILLGILAALLTTLTLCLSSVSEHTSYNTQKYNQRTGD